MLILRQRAGECIEIGADIKVCVLEVSGGLVKLGLLAPAEVPIRRAGAAASGTVKPARGVRKGPVKNS